MIIRAPERLEHGLLLHARGDGDPDIVFLPAAGGNPAALLGVAEALPPDVTVWVVERSIVSGLGPCTVPALVRRHEEGLAGRLERPFVLVGHSLGGLVAFELARRQTLRPILAGLVLCATPAPRLVPSLERAIGADDETLLSRLSALGGIPPELRRHRELLSVYLEEIRTELHALDSYRLVAGDRLAIPSLVLTARDDPLAQAAAASLWLLELSDLHPRSVPGGHFFVADVGVVAAELIAFLDVVRAVA